MSKGRIYPAGIAAIWNDLDDAVRQWSREPKGCTDHYLVTKWNRLREALLEFEAVTERGNDGYDARAHADSYPGF